ncbi:MAG: MCP four helix bundle domain-containing protein, partial [Lachnospiraceae bacterium]|nr:MCP four helix bundle domain-containing protein [Lachnospiraceae bacterium]
MNQKESIEKKLTRSFMKVAAIGAAAALVGLVVMIVMSNRYSYALQNYGFAQGDIGRSMFYFSDVRSSLRAAIGYDEQEAIDKVTRQHDEQKIEFEAAFAQIAETIVSKESRATYEALKSDLTAYWELDDKVMKLGATTDRELCRQAQEIAMNELSTAYHGIYDVLDGLLDRKVSQGDSLSKTLSTISVIVSILVVCVIGGGVFWAIQIGKRISNQIIEPLKELGTRLKAFAGGDLFSPFPSIKTRDEVEDMANDVEEMAGTLEVIIQDIGEVLSQMAGGNYAVKSKASERYVGDFNNLYQSLRDLRDQRKDTLLA